jgi:hypothetical protein
LRYKHLLKYWKKKFVIQHGILTEVELLQKEIEEKIRRMGMEN